MGPEGREHAWSSPGSRTWRETAIPGIAKTAGNIEVIAGMVRGCTLFSNRAPPPREMPAHRGAAHLDRGATLRPQAGVLRRIRNPNAILTRRAVLLPLKLRSGSSLPRPRGRKQRAGGGIPRGRRECRSRLPPESSKAAPGKSRSANLTRLAPGVPPGAGSVSEERSCRGICR